MMASVKIPKGFRRFLATILAVIITFIIIRLMFNMELSLKIFTITILSAGLGSIFSKFLHQIIVREDEK